MTARPNDDVALTLPIEDVQDTLARNLSAARGALGLSQDQLAATAGVSRATVNQLEGGASAKGDPRLSTLVSLAAALGISPVFLLLGRDELDAIAEAPRSQEAKDVRAHLSAEELETMRRLLRSGLAKNRTTAVGMGVNAAATAGATAGAIAAAAIGTGLLPGIGTALGAALAVGWLAKRRLADKKEDTKKEDDKKRDNE
jgi:transcriptional regulator with XRE-family HTH domain